MDCPGDILRGQPYGHAGREDCPRKESGDQFRKVHGSAGRQAAGMLRHDLPDPIRKLAAWIVIVIIAREFIISGFRLVASDAGIVIAASYWGKFKTVSQMFMIIVLIADLGGAFDMIGTILIWVSLILTIVSLFDYVAKNVQVLTQGGM